MMIKHEPENDEIFEVRIRYNGFGSIWGYTLITKNYPPYSRIHPFIHHAVLLSEDLRGYAKLLKEYLEK